LIRSELPTPALQLLKFYISSALERMRSGGRGEGWPFHCMVDIRICDKGFWRHGSTFGTSHHTIPVVPLASGVMEFIRFTYYCCDNLPTITLTYRHRLQTYSCIRGVNDEVSRPPFF
jgi:hypothetical protein